MTKVVEVEVWKLISYTNNNKIHNDKQVDLLANSITEYGFNTPIIIDKNNIIIAGHGRLEAAKKLWLEKVPCVIKENLTDVQVKKYRLLDNKIAEIAEDNREAIELELIDIWDLDLNELYDFAEDIDLDDLDVDDVEIPEEEIIRGIQVPVSQNLYEETFAEFRKTLDSWKDVWLLLLNMLKYENNKTDKPEEIHKEE